MVKLEYKKEYNSNLKRCLSAIDYLDTEGRTQEEVDRWLPEYKRLLEKQSQLMKICALKSGDREVLKGFDL